MTPFNSDNRYTITQEFCGHAHKSYVVRFCGEFIAQSQFYASALTLAACARAKQQGLLTL